MPRLYIDIETFSHKDVRQVGAYAHAEDPHFMILMAAWAMGDGPVHIETDPLRILNITGLRDPAVQKVAHNAAFERICYSNALGLPVGTYLDPAEWDDSMASAQAQGWPAKLEQLAKALGVSEKDTAGTRLINLFSKPNRAGRRVLPEEKPEQWEEFKAYCKQDVEVLRDIDQAIGRVPTRRERQLYVVDQHINDRGLAVDTALARRARQAAELNAIGHELELSRLTGVTNAGSNPQKLAWLRGQLGAAAVPNLQKETVDLLLTTDLDPTVRRVLELHQELALVAAKKFTAALTQISTDGRLRGQLRYHGAHTGRWTGRGVQVHNLPREQFTEEDPETGKKVYDAFGEGAAILDLALGLGADPTSLKKLVRAMFLGPLGVVDYASIEARVIAWWAGEQWALGAFRAKRDIYVETAERMSTPGHQLSRSQGKVAVLALGYNGGVNSLRVMGADGEDEDLQRLVYQWRNANPAIVAGWKKLEAVFVSGGAVGDHVTVEVDGRDRAIRLPSGRRLIYHGVSTRWVDTAFGRRRRVYFKDYRYNGAMTDTYGGRLAENVTQAIARDVLGEALVRLHEAGLRPVAHVHDEILVESTNLARITELMVRPPSWAAGLPIDGEGFICDRYRKG